MVAIAQRKNLKVVPLVGPSSIIMSVMGSGFNGQSFAFHGYLPIESGERAKRIKVLEQRVYAEDQTQLLLKLLIVIIRWWKIFLRIAVRKPNFVLLPILRVKENISRLRQ